MKSIFNEADKNELLKRVEQLSPASAAVWGKMNLGQMLAHCTEGLKMSTAEVKPKGVPFPISILGQLLKKTALGTADFRKNSPTAPELKVASAKDIEQEKAALAATISRIYALGTGGVKAHSHPFFGKMAPAEWGRLNYKHLDHHLRQFGG